MGPKKKAEDGEDLSIEQFMKNYKKNCQMLDIPVSKLIKEKYDTEYLEEGNPLTKVSLNSMFDERNFFVVSHLGSSRMARCKSFDGRLEVCQLHPHKVDQILEDKLRGRRC